MSDYTIRTTTTPPASIKVIADPSFSTKQAIDAAAEAVAAEAVAVASAATASTDAASASASATSAAGSASSAATSAADAAATLDASLKKADNLSDLSNAATARTNLGVPPSTRTISAGTGLTGGGDLSANRTISASIASQAEAEAGTSATVLMTPQRTEQHMTANALGWGQTWQDVSGSRSANTSYQNTTGKPIMVALRWSTTGAGSAQVSTDNATWVTVSSNSGSGTQNNISFIVPSGHYYRTNTALALSIWAELR